MSVRVCVCVCVCQCALMLDGAWHNCPWPPARGERHLREELAPHELVEVPFVLLVQRQDFLLAQRRVLARGERRVLEIAKHLRPHLGRGTVLRVVVVFPFGEQRQLACGRARLSASHLL